MGITDSLGLSNNMFGNIGDSITTIVIFAVFLIFFVAVGSIVTFIYYFRKSDKNSFKNAIPIFIKLNGKYYRIDVDKAREVFVPDSNIGLFYLKKRKIYIARPTRRMGKDEFWYSISENGEWVNFDLSASDDDSLAQANYDHRDTRYAYVNLKEIIKKNYQDPSQKWWKEYAHVITFIIISFVFVGSCWILLMKIGNLITQIGPIADKLATISENMERAVQSSQNLNSGILVGQ